MKKYIFYLMSSALFYLVSCEEAPYLDDEGLHNPQISVSKTELLEQNSWQLFDTLLLLIDYHDMREQVNSAPTFFAVTDFSFKDLNIPLDSLYKRYPADTLRDYIFNEKIRLEDYDRDSPKLITSASGKTFQVFVRTDNDFFVDDRWSSVEPNFLYLSKVVGSVDPYGVDPLTIPAQERDLNIRAQTQGIIDPNGNMLHVLSNLHTFGFN